MYKISLLESEKSLIERKLKKSSNAWLNKRYQVVLMRNNHLSSLEIASYVGMNINTITNWVKLYLSGGLTQLETFNLEERRISQLEAYFDQIESYISSTELVSINQLQSWLSIEHAVEVDKSWLRKWCKKKGLAIKRLA